MPRKQQVFSSVLALVLTLLALTATTTVHSASSSILDLPSCLPAFAGVGEKCGGSTKRACLGESACVQDQLESSSGDEGICYPKQIFVGQPCKHHYECYKMFDSTSTPALYCDSSAPVGTSLGTCQFSREVGESCDNDVQCQSLYCKTGACALRLAGDKCKSSVDCYPFDGQLFNCVSEVCTPKSKVNEACPSGQSQCETGLECFLGTCRQYKTEGSSCTPYTDINGETCRSGHGGDNLECIDNKCTRVRQLREKCDAVKHKCVSGYALTCDGTYGTCQNTHCTKHSQCQADEFCDCKNLVCQKWSTGNKVAQCSWVDGPLAPEVNAFQKCLNDKCKSSAFVDSVVMLNKKSCAYKNCRSEYKAYADCVKKAGETYLAKNIYFFDV